MRRLVPGHRVNPAFTLVEVVVSMALAGMCIGGIIYGYILSAQRTEWSAYNVAAQAQAMQRAEQVRSAKWDTLASPAVDEIITNNFPVVIAQLDIPVAKTNIAWATNRTTITTVAGPPPMKIIQVECSWRFLGRRVFTNVVTTYRSPDQ